MRHVSLAECARDAFGDLEWIATDVLAQRERDRRRPITVFALLGWFENDSTRWFGKPGRDERLTKCVGEILSNHFGRFTSGASFRGFSGESSGVGGCYTRSARESRTSFARGARIGMLCAKVEGPSMAGRSSAPTQRGDPRRINPMGRWTAPGRVGVPQQSGLGRGLAAIFPDAGNGRGGAAAEGVHGCGDELVSAVGEDLAASVATSESGI